jgi:hypothetical protein
LPKAKIESPELLTDAKTGLLVECTVACRPFPALRIFRDRLKALDTGRFRHAMWNYPESPRLELPNFQITAGGSWESF